jgi:hypothetical protein
MTVQSEALPTNFPAPKTPLVKKEDFTATQDLRFLLLALFNRTGGADGVPVVTATPASVNKVLLVAAGTTQANALPLTDDWNYFGTVGAGLACLLLITKPGTDQRVFNGGINNLAVFPQPAFQIDALSLNSAFILAPGKLRIFECWSTSQLVSHGN